jgi:hypothetical protein
LFFSVVDAQAKLLKWQRDYNEVGRTAPWGGFPSGVRGRVAVNPAARGEILNLETV